MRASLVAVTGALVALALWQAAARPDGTSDAARAAPPRAETHASAPRADGGLPAPVVRAIDDAAVDRRLSTAGELAAADRAALRAALVAVRRASVRARRRSRDAAWQAEQSRALVAADRLFREKLGVGIADFVAAAGPPGRVEDLGRPAS